MRVSRSIKWTSCALGAVVLGVLTGPRFTLAQERAGGAPAKPLVDATHTRMMAEDYSTTSSTAVFGQQNADGYYVYYNHFGPHQTSRPHYHDKDRWVTVIKGTWYTGEGDVFQPDKMVAIKEGGFMFHPANMHHYDGSMDDKDVIVEIAGHGPVKTVQTEVDEKGNPIGANPLNPNPPARGRAGTPARGATPAPAGR